MLDLDAIPFFVSEHDTLFLIPWHLLLTGITHSFD
jgi:hypothetical protein